MTEQRNGKPHSTYVGSLCAHITSKPKATTDGDKSWLSNAKSSHCQLRFEHFEQRILLTAAPKDLLVAEPKVIEGVLVGTLGDDVGAHELDAGQYQ